MKRLVSKKIRLNPNPPATCGHTHLDSRRATDLGPCRSWRARLQATATSLARQVFQIPFSPSRATRDTQVESRFARAKLFPFAAGAWDRRFGTDAVCSCRSRKASDTGRGWVDGSRNNAAMRAPARLGAASRIYFPSQPALRSPRQ